MTQWYQENTNHWTREIDLPFGKVRCSVVRATAILDELPPETWLASVEVIQANDPRFAEWSSGYVPPMPLSQAQAECEQIIQEFLTYGPGKWIDSNDLNS